MWESWAVITKSNFQGLFNDIGNVLTIMLSNESRTLVGKRLVAASHKTPRREARHGAPPDTSSDFVCAAQIRAALVDYPAPQASL